MPSFLYMEREKHGTKVPTARLDYASSQAVFAMLALSICPLVRTSLLSTPSSGDSGAAPATPGLVPAFEKVRLIRKCKVLFYQLCF